MAAKDCKQQDATERVPPKANGVEPNKPKRKAPVHWPVLVKGSRSPIVFVTLCTDVRKAILDREEVHRTLVRAWQGSAHWRVGRYVVMPDHIHLFCSPVRDESPELKQWVKYWKSVVSNSWPWPEEHPLWQKSFWDRQLRQQESYAEKWAYVRMNPVRKGLVSRPEDWPYQGELSTLAWHD